MEFNDAKGTEESKGRTVDDSLGALVGSIAEAYNGHLV